MFKQQQNIILASNSAGRKYVLDFANIEYKIADNLVNDADEESFKQTVEHLGINEQVQKISDYKSVNISKKYPDNYVLSGDQSSVVDGEIISKPSNKAEAIGQLLSQSDKIIKLVTSITLSKNGKIIWQHQEEPEITLRKFSMTDVESYIELEEESGAGSIVGIAGACKSESALGAHMVKAVNGSHYTIIGLPLHALIDQLYKLKVFI